MNIFKKLLALTMAGVLICGAAACSSAGKTESAPAETTVQTVAPPGACH